MVVESQTTKGLGDLPVSANSGDDFLTNVTAFGIADGACLDGFGCEVGFIHVLAKARNACFDTGDFQRLPTTRAAAVGPYCMHQLFPKHGQRCGRHEDVEPGGWSARASHTIEFTERRVFYGYERKRLGWEFPADAEVANDCVSLRTLHAEQTVVGSDIDDLNVIGNDELLESGRQRRGEAGLKIEKEFVFQAVDVQIRLDLAFGVDERGVASLACFEVLHVVGNLAVEEANAIGTTALRAGMLPEPQRGQIHGLLLRYVETRQVYSRARENQQELFSAIAKTKGLQSALWEKAAEAARVAPTPITGLFISSLNETIDLSEKRLTALQNRIPITIWLMLTLIALLTCLTFGYAQRRRFWLVSVVSPLMIAIVMGLIADLDSSRSGFIQVDLRSMERLQQDLQNGASVTSPPDPAHH